MARKIKLDALDKVFSTLIRTRDRWTCQVCGKVPSKQGLDCSHFVGRARIATRWDPENACAKCTSCHMRLTGEPHEFAEWIDVRMGKEASDALRRRANLIVKFTNQDKQDILDDYRAQLKDMQPGDDIETPAVLLFKIRSAGL